MKYRLRSPAGKLWYLHCVGSLRSGGCRRLGFCLEWRCLDPGHNAHGALWTQTVGEMAEELEDFDFDSLDVEPDVRLDLEVAGFATEAAR